MDALIFVAVAVAWAIYLIPKALSHHEESLRSRSVDRFSSSMRVLARREAVDRSNARLVVQPGRGATRSVATSKGPGPSPAQTRARRAAARRATVRRRNVLAVLTLTLLTVVTLAATSVIAWPWVVVPVALIGGWLVLCRVMVKGERAAISPAPSAPVVEEPVAAEDPLEDTSAIAVVTDPDVWDPVPMHLPTYVDAPAARRTVRTIDLDATGVWSSGRSDADSEIVREAEAAERLARRRAAEQRRATGS